MAGGSSSSGALVVRDQGGGPVIYAKFRDGSVQRERRIGPGWLVRVGAPGAKPNGKTLGEWRERRGRPVDGYLTPDAAREALPAVLTRYRAEAATRRANGSEHVTMREAADAWLEWRRHDDPGGEHRAWKHATWKNNVAYAGRMSRELGPDRVISSVTAADLRALLATGLRPERNGRPIKGRSPSRKLRATYSQTLRGIFGH